MNDETPKPFKFGRLKYGNPAGNPLLAPRCGAKNRQGKPCRCPAMKNGRCFLHGGKSTGPKTAEGRAAISRANWKHGRYTNAAIAERARLKALAEQLATELQQATALAQQVTAEEQPIANEQTKGFTDGE